MYSNPANLVTKQSSPINAFFHPRLLITGSPNSSTNRDLTRVSSFRNCPFLICIIPLHCSKISAYFSCFSNVGKQISIFSTIAFEISLNVAPLPKEFRYSLCPFKYQYRKRLLICFEHTKFLNP